MVVVAIIGILAAVAYPSYVEYVRRSQRADMTRALLEARQYLQRYHSANDSYLNAQLPARLQQSPATGAAHYLIELVPVEAAVAASSYHLRARRTGSMAGDRCGDLSVDQSGRYTMSNQATGLTLADCFMGT